jgi:hypothetical protein
VRLKVGHSHHPRKDEGRRAGEESEKNEQTAEEFQRATYPQLRERRRPWTGAQESEEFLRAVLHEEKSRSNAQKAEQIRRPSTPA